MLQVRQYLLSLNGENSCGPSIPSGSTVDDFETDENINEDLKLELFFYICNLFATTRIDEEFVWLGNVRLEKVMLYEIALKNRLSAVFFSKDVLFHIEGKYVPVVCVFLKSLLNYMLTAKRTTQREYADFLSDYLLISWWDQCFGSPNNYCLLAHQLRAAFVDSLPIFNGDFLVQIAQYPEVTNLLLVSLLHVFCLCEGCITKQSGCKSKEDPASRMLGVHANSSLQRLSEIYSKCCQANNRKPLCAPKLGVTRKTVLSLLQKAIGCGLLDSIRQRPDIPLPKYVNESIFDRLTTVRDYYLTVCCRLVALKFADVSGEHLPAQLNSLIYAAAPKHLFSLATDTAHQKQLPGNGPSILQDNHQSLISWCIENGFFVKDFALWFLTHSDFKDVQLAQRVLSRLCKHCDLLATDDSFCLKLIQRMDRVRKATLPDQHYMTLLRLVLKQLTNQSKSHLLQALHGSLNHSGATPLPKFSSLWQAQTRKLFNRLVVTEDMNNASVSAGPVPQLKSTEFLIDCELLLLTRPVRFLTELISLPAARRCPASQPAVHEVLSQLSYCFSVPMATTYVSSQSDVVKSSESEVIIAPSLLECMLFQGLDSRQHKTSSILDHFLLTSADFDTIEFNETLEASDQSSFSEFECSTTSPAYLLVQTMKVLFVQASELIPELIEHLTKRYQVLPPNELETTDAFANFMYLFFGALLFCSKDLSMQHLPALVVPLIQLFQAVFATDDLRMQTVIVNETDRMLVSLVQSALSQKPGIELCEAETQALNQMVDHCLHASFDARSLRHWVLWFPVLRRTMNGSEPVLLKHPSIVYSQQSWLIQLTEKLGLQTRSNPSAVEPDQYSPINPSLLGYLFFLASFSDNAYELVAKGLVEIFQADHKVFGSGPSPTCPIVLSLSLVLRSISINRNPHQWRRVLRLLDHLINEGVIVLFYEFPCDKSQLSGLPLIDWRGFRGTFDLAALYINLFRFWTTQLSFERLVPDFEQRSWELRLLISTLGAVTQRLSSCSKPSDSHELDPRQALIVETHVLGWLSRCQRCLQAEPLKRTQFSPQASNEIDQLFSSIQLLIERSTL